MAALEVVLRICHVSNYDNVGGASRAGYRLHRGLLSAGVDSRMLVGTKATQDEEVDRLPPGPRVFASLEWRARRLLASMGLADLRWPSKRRTLDHPWLTGAHVVNLHKIHGGHFAMSLLPRLAARVPVVWTLHETWSMTGYCNYPLECARWMTGCGQCPQVREPGSIPIRLVERPRTDLTHLSWRLKRALLERTTCVLVAPSRWLLEMVRTSPLTKHLRSEHIPYGIDCTAFTPARRSPARTRLGLDGSGRVILFHAGKGESDGGAALRLFAEQPSPPTTLLWVGSAGPPPPLPRGWRVNALGAVTSDGQMADCYAAADAFLLPTFADNLPNTIIESLASGTPVVAYDSGGVAELVRTGATGFLARRGDPADLARGLAFVLSSDQERQRMGALARRVVESELSLERQAESYLRLYRELVVEQPARAV